MNIIPIVDFEDERLKPFRNLRERTLRGESIFVAEGPLVVERLLRSPYEVESILIAEDVPLPFSLQELIPKDLPLYSIPQKSMIEMIVGFEFYHGILALGKRAKLPDFFEGVRRFYQSEVSAFESCQSDESPKNQAVILNDPKQSEKENGQKNAFVTDYFSRNKRGAWLVLPDATKPDNLGLVFRSGAALGAAGIVLGDNCCDPFSRRALRVSMGGVLQLPVFQAIDLEREMEKVRKYFQMKFYATVLDPNAVFLTEIKSWSDKTAFLLGNEYYGLSRKMIDLCDQKLMIPMRPDVDSLNLGVSAGIFLYEFNRSLKNFEDSEN